MTGGRQRTVWRALLLVAAITAPAADASAKPSKSPSGERSTVRRARVHVDSQVGDPAALEAVLEDAIADLGWERSEDASAPLLEATVTAAGAQLQLVLTLHEGDSARSRRRVVGKGALPQALLRLTSSLLREQPTAAEDDADSAGPGRAGLVILSGGGVLLGAYTGFALQRASGSESALVYPLMAVGAAIGVGSALLIGDEWRVRPPEAWLIDGSLFFPTIGVLALTEAARVEPKQDRFVFSLGGAAAGLALGGTVAAFSDATAGDALLVQSAGFVGAALGATVGALSASKLERGALAGAGAGTLVGFTAAALTVPFLDLPPSRLLTADLGFALGALGGAAVGSPLLLGKDVTDGERRAFLGVTAGGALLGAATGYALGGPAKRAPTLSATTRGWLGAIPDAVGEGLVPVVGVSGRW